MLLRLQLILKDFQPLAIQFGPAVDNDKISGIWLKPLSKCESVGEVYRNRKAHNIARPAYGSKHSRRYVGKNDGRIGCQNPTIFHCKMQARVSQHHHYVGWHL